MLLDLGFLLAHQLLVLFGTAITIRHHVRLDSLRHSAKHAS